MKFKDWLLEIFTWWNGQTIGTRFHTWRFGQRVARVRPPPTPRTPWGG